MNDRAKVLGIDQGGPYFVFDVIQYYPSGGPGDCDGIYANLEDAQKRKAELRSEDSFISRLVVGEDGQVTFENLYDD